MMGGSGGMCANGLGSNMPWFQSQQYNHPMNQFQQPQYMMQGMYSNQMPVMGNHQMMNNQNTDPFSTMSSDFSSRSSRYTLGVAMRERETECLILSPDTGDESHTSIDIDTN